MQNYAATLKLWTFQPLLSMTFLWSEIDVCVVEGYPYTTRAFPACIWRKFGTPEAADFLLLSRVLPATRARGSAACSARLSRGFIATPNAELAVACLLVSAILNSLYISSSLPTPLSTKSCRRLPVTLNWLVDNLAGFILTLPKIQFVRREHQR